MKVTWKGNDARDPETRVFDTDFPAREPRDISHLPLEQQKKLVDNVDFEPADSDARALKAAPAKVKQKPTDSPKASEFAEIWNRLGAIEADLNALRGAVLGPDPAPSPRADKPKGAK